MDSMKHVGVHEAKTHLSRLLQDVANGEEVVITRGSHPVARLVPVATGTRVLGQDAGVYTVPDDFNTPLPAAVLEGFA